MSAPKLKPNPAKKFRLITRSDMDGLVCAVLLKELGIIDDISFAHPKDMQDGLIDVDEEVITTNLPYVEGVYMAFDHHASFDQCRQVGPRQPPFHGGRNRNGTVNLRLAVDKAAELDISLARHHRDIGTFDDRIRQ